MSDKIKVAFFDAKDYDIASFNEANKDGKIKIKYFETKLDEDTVKLAKGYDAVCVFVNDTVDAKVINALRKRDVKLIALRCAGFNNVDVAAAGGIATKDKTSKDTAAKDKIGVVRVPAYSPYAVAEHAMSLLLTSTRRIHKAYIRTKDFNFSLNGLMGFDLHGKTVGVVGTGKIGRVFINICKGFGMKVIAYDKFPAKDADFEYVSLKEIWKHSDIISFHCPLTEETYHMVDAKSIKSMKKGVVLINTSRGALIDADALLEGIRNRHVGAACLDVYEEEADVFFEDRSGHIFEDDTLARLISMPNVIVTSHQAFLTKEALTNIAHTTLSNISEYLETGKCANEVNM